MGTVAVILAGGLGRRMGGRDKGLVHYRGRPLIEHVLQRLQPQVDAVVISCNRHLDDYRRLGWPTVQDAGDAALGPLAGIAAAAPLCRQDWVQLCPCDTPRVPADLTARLLAAARAAGAPAALPAADGQRHYLCSLVACSALTALPAALESGDRSVHGWLRRLQPVEVPWPCGTGAFININTPQQLAE